MKKENLTIGDRIKLLYVPADDLRNRGERSTSDPHEITPTATVIEYLLAHDPIVTIDDIDPYGNPWFSATITIDGQEEYHTLAIMDDTSWKKI